VKYARAVADTTSGTILATVDIAALPERVFRALTAADDILRWWGADRELHRVVSWEADLQPGGRFRAEGRGGDGGPPFHFGGASRVVDAPRLLAFSWEADWEPRHASAVTIRLAATPAGARVTLRHVGLEGRAEACESHAFGWTNILRWLEAYLAPAAAAYVVTRLLAPRPGFPGDITADARLVMGAHAAYGATLLAEGRAVAYGPVADPTGVGGLGVLRVADAAEARAVVDADPALRAGRGFAVELLPMIQGFARG
jgi:uncharacterized protein YndB with AHSA1/START domain